MDDKERIKQQLESEKVTDPDLILQAQHLLIQNLSEEYPELEEFSDLKESINPEWYEFDNTNEKPKKDRSWDHKTAYKAPWKKGAKR